MGLNRSGIYVKRKGNGEETCENLYLMDLMDRQYRKHPNWGVKRMKFWLQRKEIRVNLKRVRRLLRLMGLEAIYPKPRLSKGNPEHSIYTYLLRNLDIKRPTRSGARISRMCAWARASFISRS